MYVYIYIYIYIYVYSLTLPVSCGLICLMRVSSCQGSPSSATLFATVEESLR